MKIIKWSKLVIAAGLVAAGVAGAADYPERPINGVIAWGAGGGADTVTRLLTPIAEKSSSNRSFWQPHRRNRRHCRASRPYGPGGRLHRDVPRRKPAAVPGARPLPLSYDNFEPVILSVQGIDRYRCTEGLANQELRGPDQAKAEPGQAVDRYQRRRRTTVGDFHAVEEG